jgi:hypothetical protein
MTFLSCFSRPQFCWSCIDLSVFLFPLGSVRPPLPILECLIAARAILLLSLTLEDLKSTHGFSFLDKISICVSDLHVLKGANYLCKVDLEKGTGQCTDSD